MQRSIRSALLALVPYGLVALLAWTAWSLYDHANGITVLVVPSSDPAFPDVAWTDSPLGRHEELPQVTRATRFGGQRFLLKFRNWNGYSSYAASLTIDVRGERARVVAGKLEAQMDFLSGSGEFRLRAGTIRLALVADDPPRLVAYHIDVRGKGGAKRGAAFRAAGRLP